MESDNDILEKARKLHIEGNFEEALKLYEGILDSNPDNAEALNLCARLHFSLKNYDIAGMMFKKVYELTGLSELKLLEAQTFFARNNYEETVETARQIKEDLPEKHRLCALSFFHLKKYHEAIDEYEKIAQTAFAIPDDLFNLSLCYLKTENTSKALECVIPVFNFKPDDIAVGIHIASIYKKTGDYKNAVLYLVNAYNYSGKAEFLTEAAELCLLCGDEEKAVGFLNSVLKNEPENIAALSRLALIYKERDMKSASKIFGKLHKINPCDTNILFENYQCALKMFEFDKAIEFARKFAEKTEDKCAGNTFIADAYIEKSDFKNAEKYYEIALQTAEKDSESYIYIMLQLAYIYSFTRKYTRSLEILEKYKNKTAAKYDYMWLKLRTKSLPEVKNDYREFLISHMRENNAKQKAKEVFRYFKLEKKLNYTEEMFVKSNNAEKYYMPYLDKLLGDEDISGKRILVFNGDGSGDAFMFIRYVRDLLKENPAKVILQAEQSIVPVFKHNFPDLEVVSSEKSVSADDYDYAISLVMLLCRGNKDLNNIPFSEPYLKISENAIREKAKSDFMKTDKRKVGLFWQGNPSIMRNRAVAPGLLKPLLSTENTRFYSFQLVSYNEESDSLINDPALVNLAPYIKNFEDTGAFLKNIDILVTVDTSIANLAGALGIKTFLLLPFDSEWRWFFDTERTQWYKSVKIFKQEVPGDWSGVIRRVKDELSV